MVIKSLWTCWVRISGVGTLLAWSFYKLANDSQLEVILSPHLGGHLTIFADIFWFPQLSQRVGATRHFVGSSGLGSKRIIQPQSSPKCQKCWGWEILSYTEQLKSLFFFFFLAVITYLWHLLTFIFSPLVIHIFLFKTLKICFYWKTERCRTWNIILGLELVTLDWVLDFFFKCLNSSSERIVMKMRFPAS